MIQIDIPGPRPLSIGHGVMYSGETDAMTIIPFPVKPTTDPQANENVAPAPPPVLGQEDVARALKPVMRRVRRYQLTHCVFGCAYDLKIRKSNGIASRVSLGTIKGEGRTYADAARAFLAELVNVALAASVRPVNPFPAIELECFLAHVNTAIDALSNKDTCP